MGEQGGGEEWLLDQVVQLTGRAAPSVCEGHTSQTAGHRPAEFRDSRPSCTQLFLSAPRPLTV